MEFCNNKTMFILSKFALLQRTVVFSFCFFVVSVCKYKIIFDRILKSSGDDDNDEETSMIFLRSCKMDFESNEEKYAA